MLLLLAAVVVVVRGDGRAGSGSVAQERALAAAAAARRPAVGARQARAYRRNHCQVIPAPLVVGNLLLVLLKLLPLTCCHARNQIHYVMRAKLVGIVRSENVCIGF